MYMAPVLPLIITRLPVARRPPLPAPFSKHSRLTLGPRFSRVPTSEASADKASVDRFDRPLSAKAGHRELERFYPLHDVHGDEEVEAELTNVIKYDPFCLPTVEILDTIFSRPPAFNDDMFFRPIGAK